RDSSVTGVQTCALPISETEQACKYHGAGPRPARVVTVHERVSPRQIQLKAQPPFARSPPPFSGVIQSVVQREQSHFLREEIISLLRKKAISRVPPMEGNAGFYNRYFLVPKRDGNYRPILDLRVLNKTLLPLRLRMLHPRRRVEFIRPNDWFVTIDLKDTYFHVPIHHRHRRYLRFAYSRSPQLQCGPVIEWRSSSSRLVST